MNRKIRDSTRDQLIKQKEKMKNELEKWKLVISFMIIK